MKKAYFALGEAMHPLMDSSSPSHERTREWKGLNGSVKLGEGIVHGVIESRISSDRMNRSVEMLRQFYDTFK